MGASVECWSDAAVPRDVSEPLPECDGLAVAARVRVVLFMAEPLTGDRLLADGGNMDVVVSKESMPHELTHAVLDGQDNE